MYEDFSNVWHEIGRDNFVPVEGYSSRLLTIQFLCTLWKVEKKGFTFDFSEKNIYFLRKLLPATSISTNAGLFLWTNLAEVLIVMSFGAGFRVKLSMASSHLSAAIFIIQLFS